jgi:hypothetical protein
MSQAVSKPSSFARRRAIPLGDAVRAVPQGAAVTVGFEQPCAETGSSPKRLIRMFGPRSHPQVHNQFAVICHSQRGAGLTLHVTGRSH